MMQITPIEMSPLEQPSPSLSHSFYDCLQYAMSSFEIGALLFRSLSVDHIFTLQ